MIKNINFSYKIDSEPKERIKLIEDTGFDGVFLYSQYNPREYIDLLSKSKLHIETLHLPYKEIEGGVSIDPKYVNVLWSESERSDKYINWIIEEIYFAQNYGIKNVVAHITGGNNPPQMNEVGLNNILRILNVCEALDINFCMENTRRTDYIQYVFDNLKSDNLKFCFDSGHANAFTQNLETFPWHLMGNKLQCVHLHDNDGISDQHLQPFAGNINWDKLINIIYKYSPEIQLTLEVRCSIEQKSMFTEREYLELCYNSLTNIENLILK